jgi:hypothetical protein
MTLPSYQSFGLRDSEMHKRLVSRILDIPMTKMPIDDFMSGLFLDDSDCCHASSRMDGSHMLRGFHPGNSRFPCYDETTSVGPHTEISSCWEIGLRDFDLREYLVLGTSETSIPDSLRISDTHPK